MARPVLLSAMDQEVWMFKAARTMTLLAASACVQPVLDRSGRGVDEECWDEYSCSEGYDESTVDEASCYSDDECAYWGDCCETFDSSADPGGAPDPDPDPDPYQGATGALPRGCTNGEIRFAQFYCSELCLSAAGCAGSDGIHSCEGRPDWNCDRISASCAWRGDVADPPIHYFTTKPSDPIACTPNVRQIMTERCTHMMNVTGAVGAGIRYCYQTNGPETAAVQCQILQDGQYVGAGWMSYP